MTNIDLPTPLPLTQNLSVGQLSTNLLVQPTISLLSLISQGLVSLGSTATTVTTLTPAQYAGA